MLDILDNQQIAFLGHGRPLIGLAIRGGLKANDQVGTAAGERGRQGVDEMRLARAGRTVQEERIDDAPTMSRGDTGQNAPHGRPSASVFRRRDPVCECIHKVAYHDAFRRGFHCVIVAKTASFLKHNRRYGSA